MFTQDRFDEYLLTFLIDRGNCGRFEQVLEGRFIPEFNFIIISCNAS